jgi:hypothetical protein
MGSFLTLLFLAATLVARPAALVLRSGERLPVTGEVRISGSSVIFTSNGRLFSLPLSELDIEATNVATEISVTPGADEAALKLRVSTEERDRLLRELERQRVEKKKPAKNAAQPTPQSTSARPVSATVDVSAPPDPEAQRQEERYWRDQARRYEEDLRRRQEDLALIKQRVQKLQDEIISLLSLGYKPEQFSYQVLQLERSRDQVAQAELEVTRAERVLSQFREDARREGVLPGWLR